MTIYLNPQTMTKEEFLAKFGLGVPRGGLSESDVTDHSEVCVVCLVDNGPFRAAGIMNGMRDLRDFTLPEDGRPKTFYIVKTEDINREGGPDRPVE